MIEDILYEYEITLEVPSDMLPLNYHLKRCVSQLCNSNQLS